ncbi:hypothetical protein MRX96_016937 [Rhipicephalus microplus]
MSSRSPSPKLPQREASSPPAAPPLTSTTHTPPGTADSSLSALLELLKVPYTDALEDSQLDVTRMYDTAFSPHVFHPVCFFLTLLVCFPSRPLVFALRGAKFHCRVRPTSYKEGRREKAVLVERLAA